MARVVFELVNIERFTPDHEREWLKLLYRGGYTWTRERWAATLCKPGYARALQAEYGLHETRLVVNREHPTTSK